VNKLITKHGRKLRFLNYMSLENPETNWIY